MPFPGSDKLEENGCFGQDLGRFGDFIIVNKSFAEGGFKKIRERKKGTPDWMIQRRN